MQLEIRDDDMRPVIEEIAKITCGPGEAAGLCLALFVKLWKLHAPGSLEEIAEAARTMILSYQCDTLQ